MQRACDVTRLPCALIGRRPAAPGLCIELARTLRRGKGADEREAASPRGLLAVLASGHRRTVVDGKARLSGGHEARLRGLTVNSC